jgi:hypothetical protein
VRVFDALGLLRFAMPCTGRFTYSLSVSKLAPAKQARTQPGGDICTGMLGLKTY